MSVVVEFLKTVYRETNTVGSRSWQNLNSAMSAAMRLAIEARFKFEPDDFSTIVQSKLGYEYWAGSDNAYNKGERFYTLAIDENNTSAAISFEKMKDRKPFIYLGRRLAIGSDFWWWDDEAIGQLPAETDRRKHAIENGYGAKRWHLTSFSEDGEHINCCSYYREDNPYGWQNGTPTKRLRLTVKDLKTAEKNLLPRQKKEAA